MLCHSLMLPVATYFSARFCRGSRSPRADGLDREAALLTSSEVSDVSSEGGLNASLVVAAITGIGEEVEADSCGYDGDVGESTKLTPSVRRLGSFAVVALPEVTSKASLFYQSGAMKSGNFRSVQHLQAKQPTNCKAEKRISKAS